jgi:predicted transcriptional regulator
MQPTTLTTILTTILTVLLTAFFGVLGWFIKTILAKMHQIDSALNAHIVEDKQIQTALNVTLTSQIKLADKMDEKIDQINEKIDAKLEKITEKLE